MTLVAFKDENMRRSNYSTDRYVYIIEGLVSRFADVSRRAEDLRRVSTDKTNPMLPRLCEAMDLLESAYRMKLRDYLMTDEPVLTLVNNDQIFSYWLEDRVCLMSIVRSLPKDKRISRLREIDEIFARGEEELMNGYQPGTYAKV